MLSATLQIVIFEHDVDGIAHIRHRLAEALEFAFGIFRDCLRDRRAAAMQHGGTECEAAVQTRAGKAGGRAKRRFRRRQFRLLYQFAAGHQLRDDHGDGLQRLSLVLCVTPFVLILNHQHAEHAPAPQNGHAQERMKYFLAGLRPIGELRVGLGIRQRERTRIGSDVADQPLAETQSGAVNGVLAQAFRREQFQEVARPQHVDGTHFGDHAAGDQLDNAVETLLRRAAARHRIPQLPQEPS